MPFHHSTHFRGNRSRRRHEGKTIEHGRATSPVRGKTKQARKKAIWHGGMPWNWGRVKRQIENKKAMPRDIQYALQEGRNDQEEFI